jgi:cytosine/adenosine deaminase-related metal-dependent hydrolase
VDGQTDLLVRNAKLVATCDDAGRELPGGWVAITGGLTSRSWVAHCIYPNSAEVTRLGAAGVGVAHCPSSNMLIGGGGFAPVRDLRTAGAPVGLGCDGSASTDSASLWIESRAALLLGRQRRGPTGMTARIQGLDR